MPATVATAGSEDPSKYFRRTKLHWMVAIATGLAFYTWAVFAPHSFPHTYLGPFGTFMKYMIDNHNTLLKIGYVGCWLIHVAEAFISFKLFEVKGITDTVTKLKWFIQTIFFGFGSFGLLLAYDPQKRR
ncbi:transmembrane protein 254 [Tiliqua scincoides]|uniref:transmembrane protein 254 n=1 Tax=Tiliqua scincoides TaxID=71010 RepID=UPI003461D243